MKPFRPWMFLWLGLVSGPAAHAAEIGVVTLVEGAPLVLRGATWYKLAPGVRLEDSDIIEAGERAQVQFETPGGTAVNTVGVASLYLIAMRTDADPGPLTLVMPRGWLKVAVKTRELRVRMTTAEIATTDGTLVIHTLGPILEFFVESGGARFTEFLPNGAMAAARDVTRGEFWNKPADGALALLAQPPRTFIDAMPHHFVDPLPSLAARFSAKPALVADHDVSYAEAEPWLAGRDRAVFEKRFTVRLRDPAFRKAVEPYVARYPSWDRRLHPEKYRPKAATPPPAPQSAVTVPSRDRKETP